MSAASCSPYLLVLTLVLTACVPAMQQASAAPAARGAAWSVSDAEAIAIEVRHAARGAWEVEYTLPPGTERMRFARRVTSFNRREWQVLTPGLRLVSTDSFEYIEPVQGGRFDRVALRFASEPTKHEREYILTPSFTDGSEGLYTGLLYVHAQRGSEQLAASTTMRLVPAPGERIVLNGEVSDGPVEWRDTRGAGTYVYFGGIVPTEGARLIGIIDPGLPLHLGAMFERNLLPLIDHFTEAFGHSLRERPVILIGYTSPDGATFSSHGDVLPGVIRFGFDGAGWSRDDEEVRRRAFYLIAHEVVHLWNGERFESAENRQSPWLHEGSAEAFAWIAMRAFGVLDDQALTDEVEDALNLCLFLTRDRAWRDAMNAPTVPYACGGAVQMLADAAVRTHGGLAVLWRELFDLAAQDDGRYTPEAWFAGVARKSDDRFAGFLRRVLTDSSPVNVETMAAELERVGVLVNAGAAPLRRSATQRLARRALTVVMQSDCEGRFSFSADDAGFRANGLPHCRSLPRDGSLVTALDGHAIPDEAGSAYSSVAAKCASGGEISVTIVEQPSPLTIRCTVSLPAYLRISGWR